MGDFTLAEAVIDFASGTEVDWNNFLLAIPENIIVYTTDSRKFKKGDGVHKYIDLPEMASISGVAAGSATLVNVLEQLTGADEDKIIIVDNEVYKASGTGLAEAMARITAIANKDAVQTGSLLTVTSQSALIGSGVSGADNSKIVITMDHQMVPGVLPESIVVLTPSSPLHIVRQGIYDNLQLDSTPVFLYPNTTYYYKISACHETVDVDSLSFALTSDLVNAVITDLGRGLFKVAVGAVQYNTTVKFDASVTYSAAVAARTASKVILGTDGSGWPSTPSLLTCVYGGSSDEHFNAVAVDSSNNIICVGATNSEGTDSPTYYNALVVKFDSSLNILARKIYGGSSTDAFKALAIDSNNSIICVGFTYSEGTAGDALVVKFDTDLNILAKKRYGGNSGESFLDVAVDSNNNIICAGQTNSEGAGSPTYDNALIVKFDTNLNILARKIYGGSSSDNFQAVAIDSSNNIICAGNHYSESASVVDALVVKFDSNLNILARKSYSGSSNAYFYAVAISSDNNIICAGRTNSEGAGSPTYYDALVVKFDSNLNILTRKIYGGAGNEQFRGVAISSNNIICVGSTASEGAGDDALVVKFDSNLNILAKKRYGGSNSEFFYGVAVDSSNNIICAGSTSSDGAGSSNGLVLKMESNMPSGTYVGAVLTNLTLSDSNLTLADSTLTLADSTLTLAASNLTLANSTLTLADSTTTGYEWDDFATGGFIYRDILAAVYGGSGADTFVSAACDSSNNIICAGNTRSEGIGSPTYANALLVKFDTSLNILARKIYVGSYDVAFNFVTIDSNDNIICVGSTNSEGTGAYGGLVVKFDSGLNILARKICGGISEDAFSSVAVDSSNNIIIVGKTYSEGVGSPSYTNALVMKFDVNLGILARKIYGGTYGDDFNSVVVDSNNNIICAGVSANEGLNVGVVHHIFIVKFDTNLNILARKIYGGSSVDGCNALAVDSNNNIICVGHTYSEGANVGTVYRGLIVKFDSNLNILARKTHVETTNDGYYTVAVDSNDNIICVGYTQSEGVGIPNSNALVVKLDVNLNILTKKIYGGAVGDRFNAVAVDSNDNIICVGSTTSEGVGSGDALVIKLPESLPSGTFVGTTLSGLTLADSNLTLADSTLTLANSALTLANSNLTLANSNLTLANSNLTLEKDLIQL